MATDWDSDYDEEQDLTAFQTESLDFVSYDPKKHDEFFNSIQQSSSSIISFCASTPQPMSLKFTSSVAKHLQRNSKLFVMIYEKDWYSDLYKRVGTLFLESSHRDMAHHRCSKLGIGILKKHQHYEAEVIEWGLNWAFNSAGLHRVEMNIPLWNMRLGEVCKEIGFLTEGTRKECLFKDGKWWDEVNMAILEKDWKQRRIKMEN
jgi:RimJ/RimL family protein N-acetyltransferase